MIKIHINFNTIKILFIYINFFFYYKRFEAKPQSILSYNFPSDPRTALTQSNEKNICENYKAVQETHLWRGHIKINIQGIFI